MNAVAMCLPSGEVTSDFTVFSQGLRQPASTASRNNEDRKRMANSEARSPDNFTKSLVKLSKLLLRLKYLGVTATFGGNDKRKSSWNLVNENAPLADVLSFGKIETKSRYTVHTWHDRL